MFLAFNLCCNPVKNVFRSQVPAYIITLHELLALTPHDHVERNALEYAQSILEDLSTVSHVITCTLTLHANETPFRHLLSDTGEAIGFLGRLRWFFFNSLVK